MKCSLRILTLAGTLAGCATMKDSVLLGSFIGASAGAMIGRQATGNDRGLAIGAASGAAAGGLIGYAGRKDKLKKESVKQSEELKTRESGPKFPNVSEPEVRAIWVPEKIENDRVEAGHYLYLIERPSVFRRE